MNVLGIDSSALTASAAVTANGVLLAEQFVNNGLTHSETLAPLTIQALASAGKTPDDIDVIAVTNGPGSFTGVRIGVALAKGLATPGNLPCFGVSSIEAAAYPFRQTDRLLMACMDARRAQVYCAFFTAGERIPTRLTDDAAISLAEAAAFIRAKNMPVLLCGDGARVAHAYFTESGLTRDTDIALPEGDSIYQRASSAAFLTEYYLTQTDRTAQDAFSLCPTYLRLSQAERELNNKKLNNK
ncbi:MAG: tRNA (adenosine(37)-N6)-threonylcarbamoyltransferase complex dimerization subunit type 1 TsaB [Clostridia bacterium]|nr:tRNA (adenosine(37)-N6)-threonylcarbamoyltransferase complex dimerization subunit type 1 TsaB [Clostridia bacterium]